MPLHGNVSGVWKNLTAWMNVSGTWRQCVVWQNVGGVWKPISVVDSAFLQNATVQDLKGYPASALASITLNSDGSVTYAGNAAPVGYTWKTGSGAAGTYEARWTTLSGSLSGGFVGTWLPLSTTRTWQRAQSGIGSSSCTGLLEIRQASSGIVLASATITLYANVEDMS